MNDPMAGGLLAGGLFFIVWLMMMVGMLAGHEGARIHFGDYRKAGERVAIIELSRLLKPL